MIDLFYWPTPNGWKTTIALEEMGLPYRVNLIDIGAGDQFTPEFLAISPNNRMPAITDPDGPDGAPISIFESGAILQYLARKTGQFYGATERDRVGAVDLEFADAVPAVVLVACCGVEHDRCGSGDGDGSEVEAKRRSER